MGLLTGRYRPGERLGRDDVRAATPYWDDFKPGRMEAWLAQVTPPGLVVGGAAGGRVGSGWTVLGGELAVPCTRNPL